MHYLGEGLLDQVKQGVTFITEKTTGSWYLCLRNPDKLYGINASVETVAYTNLKQNLAIKIKDPYKECLKIKSINCWIHADYRNAKKFYKEYRSNGGDVKTYS